MVVSKYTLPIQRRLYSRYSRAEESQDFCQLSNAVVCAERDAIVIRLSETDNLRHSSLIFSKARYLSLAKCFFYFDRRNHKKIVPGYDDVIER